jgi:hypothetical protein
MRLLIDLPLHSILTGDRNWKTVRAEIIPDLAPHMAELMTFAVHRRPEGEWGEGWWRVSNVETGCCIGAADGPTRADALRQARDYLAKKTLQDARRQWRAFKPNSSLS